jgi:arabinose-5-phosphate isomerase
MNVTPQLIEMDDRRKRAAETMRRVLLEEADAMTNFAGKLDGCLDAANLILNSAGPLIVSGIGKSGHVARKVAATFRSLGKPAIFLHPAEASHGDLGLILKGSVLLAISNSGETSEFSDLLHFCKLGLVEIHRELMIAAAR